MHFLCLHGAGVNSQVFELQIAALRYELGGDSTYEFVEGAVPCKMHSDLEKFASPGSQHFAYYDPQSEASFRKALSDLEVYLSTEGHFDGLIAFSQGSALASAFILKQQQEASKEQRPIHRLFKCAIFFSGYVAEHCDTQGCEEAITVPTVHIWGGNDVEVLPEQHEALRRLCKADHRWEFMHGGGHEIPGPRSDEDLISTVHTIRRALGEV